MSAAGHLHRDVPRPAPRIQPLLREHGIVVSLVALAAVLSLASDAFLTTANALNILGQWAPVMIVAAASTLVLVAGGFDLSVGAVYALGGVVAAVLTGVVGAWPALALGVLAGLAVGIVNGLLVTAGRVNAFVATLATMMAVAGAAVLISDGQLVSVADPQFAALGTGRLLGVGWSIWICAAFVTVCGVLLGRAAFGRKVYAVGGSPEAARLSGVAVGRVRLACYALCGTAAGLAGVLAASRVSSGQADAGGMQFAFDAIAGVVIGGTSVMGGSGAVWRTVVGVLFLALLGNGFNLLGLGDAHQQIAQGAIIATAVAVDAWAKRKRSGR